MKGQGIKIEAHSLVKNLSDGASWDDLMKEIYVPASNRVRFGG